MKELRITQIRSIIGYKIKQKRTVRALGLHHIRDSVIKEDTPVIRGMINKVSHIVRFEELEK